VLGFKSDFFEFTFWVIILIIGVPLNCWLWWTIIRRRKKSQR